ncbi:hypothetical protein KUF54_13100 [Comamonas sp. Y33R10-2]|uniref:hypothetical protein n=1 Tax=Comamonas sp. Y33R10-2 TaxID=2853257 RepID=UPI001C5C9E10|nr:hypothetical protein [Comamonas sp. Y33R10-2]QXZ08976.1 hypothetical protein KUF54_13100 [Comamonas sp. Y33R10-2]
MSQPLTDFSDSTVLSVHASDTAGRPELRLALFGSMALLFALALLLPSMVQPDHYHAFADQRSWMGLHCAGDVLSNLGFVVAGLAGFAALWRAGAHSLSGTARALCALFFAGLLCSGAGSAFYHWAPQNASLLWDRLGMSVAFAGLLGLAVQTRMDDSSARVAAALMLLAAPISALVWAQTGNLLPWVLAQAGGMLIIFALALMAPRRNALPVALGWVIGLYAVAKLLEMSDSVVFEWTGYAVSGHSLKHWVAAVAAWPVLSALTQWRCSLKQ